MKTKHVRPVLVESKENTLHLSHGKLLITSIESTGKSDLYKSIPQELILISLEDEKIKIGELVYKADTKSQIYKHIPTTNSWYKDEKKVIARQSQIPPEYVSKFIEQYNKDCIEDLEIEMEKCWINSDNVKGNSFTEVAKFEPSINDFDAVLIIQPKLTNGFVIIVEKEVISYTDMTEQLISIETAKLAKEKGFKEFVSFGDSFSYYDEDENQFTKRQYDFQDESLIIAHKQSLLQAWLRKKYNIHINVDPTYYDGKIKEWTLKIRNTYYKEYYKSYEEALEVGLQEALKLI